MSDSGPPSVPVGPLTVSDIDGTEMTLSWQPPVHDGGSPLTGYFLEKREGRKAFWAKVARLPPDETKYRVKDLTEGTDYAFRVTAENKMKLSLNTPFV
ncbi:MAG: fibronectin type III domain-containing protein [Candidatus Thiodiazotropha sp.]